MSSSPVTEAEQSHEAHYSTATRRTGPGFSQVRRRGELVSPEIHLFVIWEHGRHVADRIVADVRAHFDVLAGFEVVWSVTPTARHFSRLYGQSLPPGSDKADHCGLGPFLLLVVEDRSPRYGVRRKWGKKVRTNTAMFDAKARYRQWTQGSRVHNSTDQQEADRDLFVLLGRRREEFARHSPGSWDGRFQRVVRDPIGTDGWRSLDELLTAVDLTLPYVLLPDPDPSSTRVRLLVEASFDAWGVEWMLAAPQDVPLVERGPEYPIVLEGREAVLELHYVGDGDMPRLWQEELLRERVRDADGRWVLSPAQAYHALLHAALGRADRVGDGTAERLDDAARTAGAPEIDHRDREAVRSVLTEHLRSYLEGRPEASATPTGRQRLRAVLTARRGGR